MDKDFGLETADNTRLAVIEWGEDDKVFFDFQLPNGNMNTLLTQEELKKLIAGLQSFVK